MGWKTSNERKTEGENVPACKERSIVPLDKESVVITYVVVLKGSHSIVDVVKMMDA